MFAGVLVAMVMAAVLGVSRAGVSLVKDGDFETSSSLQSWHCSQCRFSLSPVSHSGSHSVQVFHRGQEWSSPTQTFSTHPGQKVFFRGYVLLLSKSPGLLYHTVDVMLDMANSSGTHHYDAFGNTPHVQPGIWTEIGGDYVIPSYVTDHVRVYIHIKETDVDYLLDDVTIEEVPHPSNFKAEADKRIDQHRKQDIFIQLEGTGNPSGLTVELQQTSSSFPIGSSIKAKEFMDPANKAYQDFFYSNFNFATIANALKWPSLEHKQGQIDYDTAEKALQDLHAHGIPVRGHNIFWGSPRHTPSWVVPLSPSDLRKAMEARVQSVVGHFKGRLVHWDVSNENVHLDWYEQRLQDANITQWMFRETHRVDPQAKLFLNEFSVVSSHSSTVGLVNQARMFKAAGVPVYGIGVQCHFRQVDLDMIQYRLDEVARVGLPIWVTELDIDQQDEDKKAQEYEDVLRLLFSHPSVEGIVFWGFYDQIHWRPHAAITTGPDVHPNAAGRRFQQLVHQEWRTHVTQPLHQDQLHMRGFKGDYSIKILHNGHVISQENFTLADSPLHLRVPLSGSGSNPQIPHIIVG